MAYPAQHTLRCVLDCSFSLNERAPTPERLPPVCDHPAQCDECASPYSLTLWGRFSLAQIFGNAAIFAFTQAIGLAVFSKIFMEAILLQIMTEPRQSVAYKAGLNTNMCSTDSSARCFSWWSFCGYRIYHQPEYLYYGIGWIDHLPANAPPHRQCLFYHWRRTAFFHDHLDSPPAAEVCRLLLWRYWQAMRKYTIRASAQDC